MLNNIMSIGALKVLVLMKLYLSQLNVGVIYKLSLPEDHTACGIIFYLLQNHLSKLTASSTAHICDFLGVACKENTSVLNLH